MIQENKELLLKDLCARLPYGVICHTPKGDGHLCSIDQTIFGTEYGLNINPIERDYFNDSETEEQVIKPYLRPMSSMTEEEKEEWNSYVSVPPGKSLRRTPYCIKYMDWLLEHHFDFRHLIEKGLALEAPEEIYETK